MDNNPLLVLVRMWMLPLPSAEEPEAEATAAVEEAVCAFGIRLYH
jgi:hypothetical protein